MAMAAMNVWGPAWIALDELWLLPLRNSLKSQVPPEFPLISIECNISPALAVQVPFSADYVCFPFVSSEDNQANYFLIFFFQLIMQFLEAYPA